ncbi:MAG: signal recognition particle-docking protein FtsY [Rickettsiales bacterium]|nr:signal recognition particle-docking protein FtsY [Rickettsiales bacterium]OUV53286.1 MAG: signal recognition particle-docking protein FtsY [Rickettsiales bacterium TMED127]|tara:strand:+ start:4006 stop:4914 length:909 start_codon:yes stop_codon:yes gene_type:complete
MVIKWFDKFKKGLKKSTNKVGSGINLIFKGKKIEQKTLEELEDLLIESDIGVVFANKVIERLRKIKLLDNDIRIIKEQISILILEILLPLEKKIECLKTPNVIFLVGVNGVGKTATVGKLAHKFHSENKKVGLVAADTFRAAAVEQLEIWSKRTNSMFFSAESNSDPASLVYSSMHKAKEKSLDVLLIDTAGRLHNKSNLMDELSKMIRVIKKIENSAPNEIILVLDGNTGQNSIKQAEKFKEICNISSLIITKLDGTSKGGAIIPISEQLKIPIVSIGVGEKKEDLIDFKAQDFSKTLLDF